MIKVAPLRALKKVVRKGIVSPVRLVCAQLGMSKLDLANPVFILTTGRSGSYLVYDTLSLSPDILTPVLDRKKRSNKGIFGREHWGEEAMEIRQGHVPVEGYHQVWERSVFPATDESLGDYDAPLPGNADRIAKSVRAHYRALHLTLKPTEKQKFRLLDKDPRYLSFWRMLSHTFPDAKYLTMFRDPRAVVNSYLRRVRPPARRIDAYWLEKCGTWGPPPKGWQEHIGEPIVKRLSWQVAEIFRGLLRFEEQVNGAVLRVYYEDFVDKPKETTLNILRFMDVTSSHWLEQFPDKFSNFNPPWFRASGQLEGRFGKERFYNADERDQLQDVEDIAVQVGYKPLEIGVLTDG